MAQSSTGNKGIPKFGQSAAGKGLGISSTGMGSFSLSAVLDFFQERKLVSLAIAGILGFLFGAFFVYSDRMVEINRLTDDVTMLRDKDVPLSQYKAVQTNKKAFLKAIPPPVPERRFIGILTDLAEKHNVEISSFLPARVQLVGFYSTTTVQFSCEAPSFKDALLFINEIETLPFSVKVTSINMGGVQGRIGDFMSGTTGQHSDISIDLSVSTVQLVSENEKGKNEQEVLEN